MSSFLVKSFSLVVVALIAGAGSACTMAVDDAGSTASNGRAVVGEGATCDAPVPEVPAGWKVRPMTTFSVAVPSEGLLVSQTSPTMVQFFSVEPGTSLTAFERRDVLSLDEAVGNWKRALGDGCTVTSESSTHLCDAAVRLHATCAGDRTTDVLVVLRHGATYAAACEIDRTREGDAKGDAGTCARFLDTLRVQ